MNNLTIILTLLLLSGCSQSPRDYIDSKTPVADLKYEYTVSNVDYNTNYPDGKYKICLTADELPDEETNKTHTGYFYKTVVVYNTFCLLIPDNIAISPKQKLNISFTDPNHTSNVNKQPEQMKQEKVEVIINNNVGSITNDIQNNLSNVGATITAVILWQ